MGYSEAEVFAGGVAHIPVLIIILLYINNLTSNQLTDRDKAFAQESTFNKSEEQSEEIEKLKKYTHRPRPTETEENVKGQENLITQEERVNTKLIISSNTSGEQKLQQETSLSKEAVALSTHKNKNFLFKTSHKLPKNTREILGRLNTWQISIFFILTIGGTMFFSSQNYNNDPLETLQGQIDNANKSFPKTSNSKTLNL